MAWPEIKKLVGKLLPSEHENLRIGVVGERAAKTHLKKLGLKFLTANFKFGQAGEIDLIFREEDCLVFVEVKARSSEDWVRPAAAVNFDKRMRIVKTAAAYRKLLPDPTRVKWRYDIVEVLLEEGEVCEVRHIPNAFTEERRPPRL
jgi:putative endonuclease